MTEPKRGGFFKRLFGIPEEPAAPPASPSVELPPEFVPASDVLPVPPEPAAPEEVAAEIESAVVETGSPPEMVLHETEALQRPVAEPEPLPSPGPMTVVGGLEKMTGCLGKSRAVSSDLALSATCST